MIFAVEPLETAWAEMIALATLHWNETQAHRHYQGFKPIMARCKQYADAGWFIQFTARDAGRMVGYGGVYIVPSMHTQQLIATEDTWYLLPEYRRGWNAIKFYNFMEAECWNRGAVEVTLTLPYSKDSRLGDMLERLDYRPVSVQYSKSLVRADSATDQPAVTEKSDVRSFASTPA